MCRAKRGALVAALLFTILTDAAACELVGRVVRVYDGDTLTVETRKGIEINVRIAGIDAPEQGQPYRDESKYNLMRLAMAKVATVEWHDWDRFGRVIGVVTVDGQDIGAQQLIGGFAWPATEVVQREPGRFAKLGVTPATLEQRYGDLQKQARSKKRGLWAEATPTKPSVWRDAGTYYKRAPFY
jgi:endonuclease YncB( thermonuclease family)